MPFYHRSISLKDSWYPCSFNLTYRASVAGAPSNFIAAIEAAALMIRKVVLDDVTFNISVGYDEVSGINPLGTSGGSSLLSFSTISYTLLRSALIAKANSSIDASVLASMPAGTDIGDGIHSTFNLAQGQMKALGLSDPHASGLEAQIGIGALIPEGNWIGAMLHELTHAMGRSPGFCDWVIWSASGVRQFTGSQPYSGYFSVDGGVTNLGNMSTWDSPSFTGITSDPLDEFYTPGVSLQYLTPLDVKLLDAIGFKTS